MNKTFLKLDLDLDFILIAITAPLKDYTLCHKINTNLAFEFEKISDHEVFYPADDHTLWFSKFSFFIEEGEQEYYLIANKCSGGLLVPEMPRVDFFLIIRGYIDTEGISELIMGLNRLQEIQVAAKINPYKLKSKENLVL